MVFGTRMLKKWYACAKIGVLEEVGFRGIFVTIGHA